MYECIAEVRSGGERLCFQVWGYSILCVSIINLTSVLGVAILPFMTKVFYSRLLSALIGSLLIDNYYSYHY